MKVRTERRILVAANGGREKEAIADVERLLNENTERLLDGGRFTDHRDRARADVLRRGGQLGRTGGGTGESLTDVLGADGRLEVEVIEVVGGRGANINGDIVDVDTVDATGTEPRSGRERRPFPAQQQVLVATSGPVVADGGTIRQPAERTPVGAGRPDEAINVLAGSFLPHVARRPGAVAVERRAKP